MSNNRLKDLIVLQTRPKEQSKSLTDLLIENGAKVIAAPMLEIKQLNLKKSDQENLLGKYDKAIFVSPNAVKNIINYLPNLKTNVKKFFAIGKGTARELNNLGINKVITPLAANSESMILLLENENIYNQKILLLKGIIGRDLIKENLQAHNAKVIEINLYESICPQIDKTKIKELLKAKVNIILATSASILNNLYNLLNDNEELWSKSIVVVASERILNFGKELGIKPKNWVNACGATDQDLFQALLKIKDFKDEQ